MRKFMMFSVTAFAATLFAGCGEPGPTPPGGTSTATPLGPTATTSTGGTTSQADHSHGEGPHGGTIADWGGGKYHVEFTVDHDKKSATVYILGDDAKTPVPLKTKDGKLQLTINEPSTQLELAAAPEAGEPEGAASKFTGTHDTLGIVREFAGSITGEVDGTPYTAEFKEEPHDHDHEKPASK